MLNFIILLWSRLANCLLYWWFQNSWSVTILRSYSDIDDFKTPSQSLGEGNGTPLQYSCLENPMDRGAWSATVHDVAKSRTWLSDFTFTFHFHALEKEMVTQSSVLAWRIPGTAEPGGLPSTGSRRVRHNKWLSSSSSRYYIWGSNLDCWDEKQIKWDLWLSSVLPRENSPPRGVREEPSVLSEIRRGS